MINCVFVPFVASCSNLAERFQDGRFVPAVDPAAFADADLFGGGHRFHAAPASRAP